MLNSFRWPLIGSAAIVLCACVSSESLQRRTVAKVDRCLIVGLSTEQADDCMRKAGLAFDSAAGDARKYIRSASGPWLFSESSVYFTLQFDDGASC
jgi:hypothetical protein